MGKIKEEFNANSVISQITLPTGTTYDLKDATARTNIETLVGTHGVVALGDAAWKAVETTLANDENLPTGAAVKTYVDAEVAKIPKFEVVICAAVAGEIPAGAEYYDDTTTPVTQITGTMAAAASTMYKIYFVKNTKAGAGAYIEWMTIRSGSANAYTYTWEAIGSTVIDLSNYVQYGDYTTKNTTGISVAAPTITITSQGSGSGTLKYDTTTVADSWVTTGTAPKYVADTTKLSAAGTGGGYASPTNTVSFVKSYPGATSKLVKTTVTGVSGSTTASKATAGTAVNVATVGTAKDVAKAGTAVEAAKAGTAVSNVAIADTTATTIALPSTTAVASGASAIYDLLKSMSVTGEVLSFTGGNIDEKSTKLINSATSITPAVAISGGIVPAVANGTITPAVANGTIIPYTFDDVTVPVAASAATTVATGSLDSAGTGAEVMTGLGTAVTATAITALGTFTPSSITISSGATGDVSVATGVSTSGTNNITASTVAGSTTKTVLTTLGTGSSSASISTTNSGIAASASAPVVTDNGHKHQINAPATFTITPTLTNVTADGDNPTEIKEGRTVSLTYHSAEGYNLPASAPTVTGATVQSWVVTEE